MGTCDNFQLDDINIMMIINAMEPLCESLSVEIESDTFKIKEMQSLTHSMRSTVFDVNLEIGSRLS